MPGWVFARVLGNEVNSPARELGFDVGPVADLVGALECRYDGFTGILEGGVRVFGIGVVFDVLCQIRYWNDSN